MTTELRKRRKKAIVVGSIITGSAALLIWLLIQKARAIPPVPPVCEEGETKCVGFDLHECKDGTWQLKTQNSPECGFVCEEGETKCVGFDLHECKNNAWTIKQKDSEECGYVVPEKRLAITEDTYCSSHYPEDNFGGDSVLILQSIYGHCVEPVIKIDMQKATDKGIEWQNGIVLHMYMPEVKISEPAMEDGYIGIYDCVHTETGLPDWNENLLNYLMLVNEYSFTLATTYKISELQLDDEKWLSLEIPADKINVLVKDNILTAQLLPFKMAAGVVEEICGEANIGTIEFVSAEGNEKYKPYITEAGGGGE